MAGCTSMSAASLPFAPWQQRLYAQAAASLDGDRLGHALLLCGPARLGKRAIAERLAGRALCRSPDASGEACGSCRSCQLLASGTHPDFHVVSFVHNKEGTRLRTEIVIDQVRALSARFALTPQYGGAQIVIVDPVDAVNHSALNALLKTLEEPQPGRYLWLISNEPSRLPATIRSRCQRLPLPLPRRVEALAWLVGRGHPQASANEALDAAGGHPGLADDWLSDGSLALRRQVLDDLAALARDVASPSETAQRWSADEQAGLRLRFAAGHALAEATRLTDPMRTRSLATWFDSANRTHALLRTTVRADLAIAELLLAWPRESMAHASRGHGR